MAIYLSRKKGGTVATPITPSNLNPAQMTANVAVNPTANGYAIASYSHKTPSNSSPVALNYGEIDWINGNGYAIQSYTDVTSEDWIQYVLDGQILKVTVNPGDYCVIMNEPDIVTPSNSNPPELGMGFAYSIRGDNGYLIESYDDVTPSDSSPVALTSGDIVKLGGNGYAVQTAPITPTDITPSSEFELVFDDSVIKLNGNGLVIAPTSVERLYIGDALVEDHVYIADYNGVMVSSVTDITPSNSSPVSLSSGTIYKPSASGYAISSYSSKTPSDSSPASVSSGAIIKASASGYLYASSGLKNVPTYFSGISATTNNSSSTNSVSVTNGKKYLFIALRHSTSGTASDTGISSGATVDKVYVNNVATNNSRVKLYVAMVTATSSTISALGTGNICSVLPLN